MANQYSHFGVYSHHPSPPPPTVMWCTNCQQDVPAIAHGDMARCAQCGRFLKRRPEASALSPGENWSEDASSAPKLPLAVAETTPLLPTTPIASAVELDDDWTLQQRVHHLQHRLRFDNAALTLPTFHSELLSPPIVPNLSASQSNQSAYRSGRAGAFIAWFAITVGTVSFLCGCGLLTWWFIDGSRELWSLGLPLATAGQFGLLFGLVLQLNRLWRSQPPHRRISPPLRQPTRRNKSRHSIANPAHGISVFTHLSRSPATHF